VSEHSGGDQRHEYHNDAHGESCHRRLLHDRSFSLGDQALDDMHGTPPGGDSPRTGASRRSQHWPSARVQARPSDDTAIKSLLPGSDSLAGRVARRGADSFQRPADESDAMSPTTLTRVRSELPGGMPREDPRPRRPGDSPDRPRPTRRAPRQAGGSGDRLLAGQALEDLVDLAADLGDGGAHGIGHGLMRHVHHLGDAGQSLGNHEAAARRR